MIFSRVRRVIDGGTLVGRGSGDTTAGNLPVIDCERATVVYPTNKTMYVSLFFAR